MTHHHGSGSHPIELACIIFGASWFASMTEDKVCDHPGPSGSTEDGYHYTVSYGVNGQDAGNPEDGATKSVQMTAVDVNEGTPHIRWTNETIPDGTHTEGDIPLYPPDSVTVDVSGGEVSNLQPDKLGKFGESQSNQTQNPDCRFDKTVDESSGTR